MMVPPTHQIIRSQTQQQTTLQEELTAVNRRWGEVENLYMQQKTSCAKIEVEAKDLACRFASEREKEEQTLRSQRQQTCALQEELTPVRSRLVKMEHLYKQQKAYIAKLEVKAKDLACGYEVLERDLKDARADKVRLEQENVCANHMQQRYEKLLEDIKRISASVKRRPLPRLAIQLPAQCQDLLRKLLRWDPVERISLEEILLHPWMTGHVQVIKKKHNPNLKKT